MDRDIAYKCSFCDVIFEEFESILKHNRYYCHKRKSLPRSSTVTTAMLANFQSAGGSGTSQDSSSTSHSPKLTAGVSRAEPTFATTSENSPQAGFSKDTTTLRHEHTHSTAPEAAANFKPETNAVVRYNREPMQSSVPEGATDFIKHPTSAGIAMLASFLSAGGSGTSQDSSSTSHSPKSTAGVSRAEPTSATTSGNSPQAGYSKDTTTLRHEHAHSSAPGAAANFKPETNVVVRYNREPMQPSVSEGASAGIASQSLPSPFRDISDLIHPTSAAITLQRLQALAKDVLTDFQCPTSGATAQHEPMNFRVPEFASDGRLTSGSSPFKREHMDSDVLNVGEEDSELLESGSKRRKLSDEDELE